MTSLFPVWCLIPQVLGIISIHLHVTAHEEPDNIDLLAHHRLPYGQLGQIETLVYHCFDHIEFQAARHCIA